MRWVCIRCGRASDHLVNEDAERELNQFDCAPALEDAEQSENPMVN
jgi:hypothetical protein